VWQIDAQPEQENSWHVANEHQKVHGASPGGNGGWSGDGGGVGGGGRDVVRMTGTPVQVPVGGSIMVPPQLESQAMPWQQTCPATQSPSPAHEVQVFAAAFTISISITPTTYIISFCWNNQNPGARDKTRRERVERAALWVPLVWVRNRQGSSC